MAPNIKYDLHLLQGSFNFIVLRSGNGNWLVKSWKAKVQWKHQKAKLWGNLVGKCLQLRNGQYSEKKLTWIFITKNYITRDRNVHNNFQKIVCTWWSSNNEISAKYGNKSKMHHLIGFLRAASIIRFVSWCSCIWYMTCLCRLTSC